MTKNFNIYNAKADHLTWTFIKFFLVHKFQKKGNGWKKNFSLKCVSFFHSMYATGLSLDFFPNLRQQCLFCFYFTIFWSKLFYITCLPACNIHPSIIDRFTFVFNCIMLVLNQIGFYSEHQIYLNLTISCLLYDTEKWHGMN